MMKLRNEDGKLNNGIKGGLIALGCIAAIAVVGMVKHDKNIDNEDVQEDVDTDEVEFEENETEDEI